MIIAQITKDISLRGDLKSTIINHAVLIKIKFVNTVYIDMVPACPVHAISIINEIAAIPPCHAGCSIYGHGVSCQHMSPGGGKPITTSSLTQLSQHLLTYVFVKFYFHW
jgi:hypothetical protein